MIYFRYRFDIARKAAGLGYRAGTKVLPAVQPDEELPKQIPRLRSRELAVAGVFWLTVVLLLMMFKPF